MTTKNSYTGRRMTVIVPPETTEALERVKEKFGLFDADALRMCIRVGAEILANSEKVEDLTHD